MDNNSEVLSEELSLEHEFQKERIGFTRGRALLLVAAVIVLAAALLVIALLLPKASGQPVFSEVMTSNHGTKLDPYGAVDWIEIYNLNDKAIDLSGYGFTNDVKHHAFRYRFPDGTTLGPGEYLVLYCTGGTEQSDNDPFCTGFNLSASGEVLFLVTPKKVEADEVTVPPLETDTAYARTDTGGFAVTEFPTPGEANRFE